MDSKILYLDSHTHKCILFQYFDGGVRVENGNLIFMIHTHTHHYVCRELSFLTQFGTCHCFVFRGC